jgi:hypothetical protein
MFTKKALVLVTIFSLTTVKAMGQKTAITDIPTDEETTISIKKGDKGSKCEKLYEIVEGTGQVEGDPSVLVKEARATWKQACSQWKKEVREMNQDSKVMVIDCGQVNCSSQGSEGQVCRSEGKYKIKTKMN